MKTLVANIILVLSLHYSHLSAQSRTSGALIEWENSKRIVLDSAIGWYHNEEIDRWISNQNQIYRSEQELRLSFAWNIDSVAVDAFTLNKEHFYVLLFYKKGGYYQYPTLEQDWITTDEIRWYAMNDEGYSKLREVVNSPSDNIYFIDVVQSGELDGLVLKANERTLMVHIRDELTKEITIRNKLYEEFINLPKRRKKEYEDNFALYLEKNSWKVNNSYFPITHQSIDGKEVIRFMPQSISIYGLDDALTTMYFEVPAPDFKGIMMK
jgi:hypothetical protein